MQFRYQFLTLLFSLSVCAAEDAAPAANGDDPNWNISDIRFLGEANSCIVPEMIAAFRERPLGKVDNEKEDIWYRIFVGMDSSMPVMIRWLYEGPDTLASVLIFKQIARDKATGKWSLVNNWTISINVQQHKLLQGAFDDAGLTTLTCADYIPASVAPGSSSWVYECPVIGGHRIMVRRFPRFQLEEQHLLRANVTMARYNREVSLKSLTLMLLAIGYGGANK
jgi:hypothetical protein